MTKTPTSRAKAASTRPAAEPQEGGRRREIVETAAAIFRRAGYRDTSMRQIAQDAGIQGASLYHHFPSKQALYVEVHALVLGRAEQEVIAAIAGHEEAWARLEAACVRHLEMQLDPASATLPLMNDLPLVEPEVRRVLVTHRDRFEQIYQRLIEALPLDPGLDRDLYRILLLSMLNNAAGWFQPGRRSIATIGREIIKIFRHEQPGS